MKRLLSAALLALSLTGCAGFNLDPVVQVATSALDENTSTAKGATAGMSSSDAANVLMNRDYYNAVKAVSTGNSGTGKGAVQLEIEAHDGRPITIDAKVFRTYHAPQAQSAGGGGLALKAPPTIEPTGIKWFRELKDAVVETAQVVLPWKMVREQGKTIRHESDNNTAARITELGVVNNAVTGSQSLAGQAIETYRPAEPIIVPAHAAPTE
jgi:hypothetical protein